MEIGICVIQILTISYSTYFHDRRHFCTLERNAVITQHMYMSKITIWTCFFPGYMIVHYPCVGVEFSNDAEDVKISMIAKYTGLL